MSNQVSIWGVFEDQVSAGEALSLLEFGGFHQSQIAIQKRFKGALGSFDWGQAIYVRLPEGIVLGFAGGGLLCAAIAVAVSRGMPHVIPAALFICVGSVIGTVLGAFTGMIIAKFETSHDRPSEAGNISIGVLCVDSEAEDRAKVALHKAGASTVETIA